MPNTPSFGAFLPNKLNATNSPSPFGQQDAYGINYPSGLTNKRVIELSFSEAQNLQAGSPSIEQLYEGLYQYVQVDSGATQSEVNAGLAAFYKINTANNNVNGIATVTGETAAGASNLFAGVFLNPITIGNFGWIFSGKGRVNVTYKSSLGTAGAIGNTTVFGGGGGLFDGGSATAVVAKTVGVQVVAATANGTSPIFVNDDYSDVGGSI